MNTELKKLLKKITPNFVWSILKLIKERIELILFSLKIKKLKNSHLIALDNVRKKENVRVVFLLIHESVWKYEGVYRLMEKDKRFDPLVIVCPYIKSTYDQMLIDMNHTYDSFSKEGCHVIKALKESGEWVDVKKEICPDLVCFTNPWDITRPEYLISNFLDTLTCYVPYGFKNSYLYWAHFKMPTQNLTWKFFLETEIHKKLAKKYAPNKGINTIVTGYPGMDKFLIENYDPVDKWKIKDTKVKRIIWAPHHTLPGMGATLDYSTFFNYYEDMLNLADKYKREIQIAFKPHPVLRTNLSKPEVWGKEKTDLYYQKWSDLENGLLQEGEYIDLFLTSDGMIHDSSSFVIEYLYTNKPVMFLINNDSVPDKFNEIGKMAFSKLYHGKNINDIEKFINQVIINGNDKLKEERSSFFNSLIKPPNGRTASENIYIFLKSAFTPLTR